MRWLLLSVMFATALRLYAADAVRKTPRFLEPVSLSAAIFPRSPSNSPALFTFRRTARLEGSSVIALREYFASDGTAAAKETVVYERDQLRRFVLEESQISARGSAMFDRTPEGKTIITFEYETGAETKRKRKSTETQSEVVLISDTIPAFISDHWEKLTNGQVLRFRYAIIPRVETIAFTLRNNSQTKFNNRPVAQIEMRPASRLLQRFVDPIVFSVEYESPHRILQYVGRTTPKMRRGRAWDDLEAITIFDWKSAKR